MQEIVLRLYDNSLAEQADLFKEQYDLECVITAVDQPAILKEKEMRSCRFCKGKFPAVTFNNAAHIIPHQLGNELLISDFECDKCNKLFSNYEAQLANYLGISRTVNKVKGKKGVPDFYSPGNRVTAKIEDLFNVKDSLNIQSLDGFQIDTENGTTELEFDVNPYKPIQVFKAIARIGFCMMTEEELKGYAECISQFLLEHRNDQNCKAHPILTLVVSVLPQSHNTFALLFQRKTDALVPRHILCLFTQSYLFQLALPFHEGDQKNCKPGFSTIVMPPFHFNEEYPVNQTIETRAIDMSSSEPFKGKGHILLKFDPSQLDNLVAYDPATKTHIKRKLEPGEIVGLRMINSDQVVKFPTSGEPTDDQQV